MSSRLKRVTTIAGIAVIYALASRLGMYLESGSGFARLVSPSAGIAAAALVLNGNRTWPGVAIGAIVANLWQGSTFWVACTITCGNLLEATAIGLTLRKLVAFRPSLDRLRDALSLVGSAIPACALAATVGVGALWQAGEVPTHELGERAVAWWWRDMLGVLLVAPVILTMSAAERTIFPRTTPRRIELALLLTLLVTTSYLVFYWREAATSPVRALIRPYLLYPLLLWGALRFGPRGCAAANLVVCLSTITVIVLRFGPLGLDVRPNILALQSFLAVGASTSIICAAMVAELGLQARLLKASQGDLEEKVKARTAELRQANEDLERREAQLREAQSLVQLGSFDWDIARNRTTWSDGLYRIIGVDSGTPLTLEGFVERIHPDDRADLQARVEKILADRHPFSARERIVRPDGSIRVLQSTAKLEIDAASGSPRLIGTCQDITEQAAAEATRAHLAAIVETSTDAIISRSVDGIIQTWNQGAERVYGYSAEEAIGQPMWLVVPEDRREELARVVERVCEGECVTGFETVRQRKGGEVFDTSLTFSPLRDASGRCTALSVIARDITDIRREAAERQRIEVELRRSLDEKVVLLREIHHRVKNNLQVIASLLNLQSANADSEVQQVFAESQNRVHAIALVHELLYRAADLAHIELDRYLENLVTRLTQTYGTDAGRVTVTASAPDIHLDIDTAVPCGLMVNELVSNALKHGFPEGRRGTVEVAMNVGPDGNVVLTVRDDGVGLPGPLRWEEVRSLGLQIVGSLAKQLKGTFRIWSDQGTTACVSFPPAFSERLGRPSLQEPPPSTPQPSSSRPSNGRGRVAQQGVRQ